MKTINFWMLLVATMMFIACGDDDDGIDGCGTSFSFQAELTAEANALSAAASAYAQDQSTANCNAYKDAANDYLDAADDLEDCARQVGQGAEFDAAIKDARDGVDAIQC